jgi:hypothetical protein
MKEILKTLAILVVGIVIGYYLRKFTGKERTVVEYVNRYVTRDTCYSRTDTIMIAPVIRKGNPVKTVIVEYDTVVIDKIIRDTLVKNDFSWKRNEYKQGFLTIHDSLFTDGPIWAWNRKVVLDTLDIQTRFQTTHIVQRDIVSEVETSKLYGSGKYDTNNRFGAGLVYVDKRGFLGQANYYPGTKHFDVGVGLKLVTFKEKK